MHPLYPLVGLEGAYRQPELLTDHSRSCSESHPPNSYKLISHWLEDVYFVFWLRQEPIVADITEVGAGREGLAQVQGQMPQVQA